MKKKIEFFSIWYALYIYCVLLLKMSNACWCFPEESEFKTQYMKQMENKYVAEKTLKTVTEWLAGENKKDFRIVAHYAESDFNEYMNDNPPQFIRRMNIDDIHETLSAIAKPCECDK